jgi:hypothetical protein
MALNLGSITGEVSSGPGNTGHYSFKWKWNPHFLGWRKPYYNFIFTVPYEKLNFFLNL